MRIAFFSDVHGNPIALEAVLRDIAQQGGVDEYWALGDIVAVGHDPARVIEMLTELPNVRALSGNTERYVLTGERPPPTADDVFEDPSRMPHFVEVARSFAWTEGYLAATGRMSWLAGLPKELRTVLPDGTTVLAVHSTPKSDEGAGLRERHTDEELAQEVDGCDAELVLAGHTHRPFTRLVGEVRIVNLGSVSNPVNDDCRASYMLLRADTRSYRVEHRQVRYDVQAVIRAISESAHPGKDFLIRHFQGKVQDRFG